MILDVLGIGTAIKTVIYGFFISMDAVVYYFVSLCYRLFILLATINIFDVDDYNALVDRIYIILGVIMLFILSYSMLKAIVDPDGPEKSDDAPAKIVGKTVTSLILVIVMPVIFEYAYGFQIAILKNNTLGKIILGSPGGLEENPDYSNDLQEQGMVFSMIVFRSFFRPNEYQCAGYENFDSSISYTSFVDNCEKQISVDYEYSQLIFGPWIRRNGHLSLDEAHIIAASTNFAIYTKFAKPVVEDKISYMFPISLVAGVFLCYVMISFCFDLGIRVAKLAFLQIIAPIPIFARIMPGSAKDIFNNWVKKTSAVFLEVFMRVIIMFFGVYLINVFSRKMWDVITGDMVGGDGQWFLVTLAKVFVIMGIIAFIKQAPKLLGEIFPGMNSDSMSLGIVNKLGAGGGLAMAAGVGGLATAGLRGFAKSRAQGKNLARSLFGGGLGGAASGGRRALWQSRKAQTWGEMREGASEGIGRAADARTRKETYKANPDLRKEQLTRQISDFYHGPVDMERLENKKKVMDDIGGGVNRIRAIVSDDDKLFQTMMQQADEIRKREIPTSVTEFDEAAYRAAFNAAFTKGEDTTKINREDFMKVRDLTEQEMTAAIEAQNKKANDVESSAKSRSAQYTNLLKFQISNEMVKAEMERTKSSDFEATKASLENIEYNKISKAMEIDVDKVAATHKVFHNAVAAENAKIADASLQYVELRNEGVAPLDLNVENFAGSMKELNDKMQQTIIPQVDREIAESRRTSL